VVEDGWVRIQCGVGHGDTPFPLSLLPSCEIGGVISGSHLVDCPHFTSNISFVYLRLLHTM